MKEEKQRGTISIKVKLLGIILPVVILIMVLLVGISYFISRTIIRGYSEDLLTSSIENQANQIEAWLNENLAAFQMAKQAIEETNPQPAELQGILDGYYGFNDNYPDGLYIADADGNLMKAAGSGKTEADPAGAVWYQEGLTRWNMGFTKAYTISASGILKGDTGALRVISADLTLERISIIVNSYIGMDQARAFLVSSADGTVLAHHDNALISTKLSGADDAFLRDIGEKVAGRDYAMAEIDRNMTAFAQIQGTDWILVSYIPTDVIYADIKGVRTLMIVIGLLSVLVLAVMVERVVHMVIRPVKELTRVVTAMTGGDFTIEVRRAGNDEIGVMSRYVERFISSMREMIRSIHAVSGRLNEQAGNSDEVSGQMYDASRLQSQSMKELNTTVEQLSLSVNEIADNATTLAMVVADTKDDGGQVESRMKETVAVSVRGKEDMQRVSGAMKDINASMETLQQAIDKVGKASEEINDITTVIGNIADQTDLLSLNASIEAARAGEAGRNIENLIGEINVLVGDTIRQTGESVKNINNSSTLVGNALRTFDTIFNNIEQVNGLVQGMIKKVEQVDDVATNVAAISQEQAASSEEILATSETMVEQADHITRSSERVSDGARELTASAEELYGQIARFRTEKEAGVQ